MLKIWVTDCKMIRPINIFDPWQSCAHVNPLVRINCVKTLALAPILPILLMETVSLVKEEYQGKSLESQSLSPLSWTSSLNKKVVLESPMKPSLDDPWCTVFPGLHNLSSAGINVSWEVIGWRVKNFILANVRLWLTDWTHGIPRQSF